VKGNIMGSIFQEKIPSSFPKHSHLGDFFCIVATLLSGIVGWLTLLNIYQMVEGIRFFA
jgi:hypothetical protein